MAWLSSRRKHWESVPPGLRLAGGLCAALAIAVLVLAFFLTSGARQARISAAAHYERAQAVSASVSTYTHSCDLLAASRNVRALSELSSAGTSTAQTWANQAMQDVWNVNTLLPADSSVAVFYPTLHLFVSKSQFKFSTDLKRLFENIYPGLSYEDLASQDTGVWHSYCTEGYCYIVRSIPSGISTAAYIVAKFPVESLLPTSGRSIVVIGDGSSCLYASKAAFSESLYPSLLSPDRDRQITVRGTQFNIIRNEFSGLSLRFYTLVPTLTAGVLAIRAAGCLLFLCLLAAPELALHLFEKRKAAAEKALALTPQGAQCGFPDNHYALSGLTKALLDMPKERDYRISQQCYRLLGFAQEEVCAVIGFSLLEDQERLFDAPAPDSGIQRPITPYFILNNILQDLLFDRHKGALCYCDGKYVAFSGLLPSETEADFQAIVQQALSGAKNFLSLTFVSAAPIMCHGYKQFNESLTRSVQELDYARLWWRTESVPDMQKQSSSDFYNRLGLLNSCILENNYAKAEETFHYMLQNCIPASRSQVRDAASKLVILLDTLVSLSGYPRDQLPANAVPPKTVAACQEAGDAIFCFLRKAQGSAGANPAKDRIRAISEYVQENYSDPELSVGTIAARFGMNAAYLSRAFKDSTGTNLLEFIHRTRIAASKKLLPEHPIKEVSTLVGFADAQSFVRTFRKYETISPAEFRRNCTLSGDSLPK